MTMTRNASSEPRFGAATASGPANGWRRTAIAISAANSLAALGGAVGLVAGWLSLHELTDRLPLDSPVLGGVALGLLVAVPQGVAAVTAVRHPPVAATASVVVGLGLVGWIGLEVAFLREV